MQNTDAVAWTKKLVGIESTNPGKEEHEIAGFLEHEIRAVLPERGELKKDYTREGRPVLLAVLPGETKEEMAFTNCPAVKLLVNPFPCTTFANNGFKDTCRMVLPIPNKANAT